MKVAVFSTHSYDCEFLDRANAGSVGHQLTYLEARLEAKSAALAADHEVVCAFVNDSLARDVLEVLAINGVKLIVLRCAGFNNVDLEAALDLGLLVARVPAYSPDSVAEHTVALILALDRKIHRAYARVREGNFALDGLLGFGLRGRTVGIIGTGKIGLCVARIMRGFGCDVIGFDPLADPAFEENGGRYVSLNDLFSRSDIITLHCPLTPQTRHLIDDKAIEQMKPGATLVNTSRGAVIDTKALVDGLKAGKIGNVGLDVYEEEGDLFFEDLSNQVIQDDVFARLLTFPNVIVTGHQGFFTREAMSEIAATTIANISSFERTGNTLYPVSIERLA